MLFEHFGVGKITFCNFSSQTNVMMLVKNAIKYLTDATNN